MFLVVGLVLTNQKKAAEKRQKRLEENKAEGGQNVGSTNDAAATKDKMQ